MVQMLIAAAAAATVYTVALEYNFAAVCVVAVAYLDDGT